MNMQLMRSRPLSVNCGAFFYIYGLPAPPTIQLINFSQAYVSWLVEITVMRQLNFELVFLPNQ